jgi:hypothetical protein
MLKILVIILLIIAIGEASIIYNQRNILQEIYLPTYYFSEADPRIVDDYFTAKGSWVSDTKLANPAQTTEIHCYKDFGYCVDSTAELFDGKTLSLFNELYEIDTWSKDTITTKPSKTLGRCVEYTMKIDRVRKKVTSLRTTIDNTSEFCEAIQDAPIISQLGDGQERLDKIRGQE